MFDFVILTNVDFTRLGLAFDTALLLLAKYSLQLTMIMWLYDIKLNFLFEHIVDYLSSLLFL